MKIVFSTIRPISDKADLKVKPKRIEAKDRLVKETGTFENEEEIENATIENVLRIGPGYAEKRIGGDDVEGVLEDVEKMSICSIFARMWNCKFCIRKMY